MILIVHLHSLFSYLFNSEDRLQKGCGTRSKFEDVSSSAITGQHVAALWRLSLCLLLQSHALRIRNECRINPLKKTKGPWHWSVRAGSVGWIIYLCMAGEAAQFPPWTHTVEPQLKKKKKKRQSPSRSFSRHVAVWFTCFLSSLVR